MKEDEGTVEFTVSVQVSSKDKTLSEENQQQQNP